MVARNGMDEGFGHSVAPRTFDRRGSRFETDVAGKAAGIAGEVAAGWCLDGRCHCQNRDKLRALLSLGFGRGLKVRSIWPPGRAGPSMITAGFDEIGD
jgi:hypothetical protein